MTNSTVFTLFEGHYHLGAAALFNSLHQAGFRGTCYAGVRHLPPPWTSAGRDGRHVFEGPDGFRVEIILLETDYHLTNYKPVFFTRLWEEFCPDVERLFYIDPDVIVKRQWSYFEDWVDYGVALVQDVNPVMPLDHPVRQAWQRFCQESGFTVRNALQCYYNGGFVGVHRKHAEFIGTWHDLMQAGTRFGFSLDAFSQEMNRYPYFSNSDQDFLNIAAMVSTVPLSTVGPAEMDFFSGGTLLSHAMGRLKPWRRNYLSRVLQGIPPGEPDKRFWHAARGPIQIFKPGFLRFKRLELAAAAAIGRVYRRT
ncbi:MAG TPA: hypothetical protein VIT91_12495 [Chthoniobacterales bacterium]